MSTIDAEFQLYAAFRLYAALNKGGVDELKEATAF